MTTSESALPITEQSLLYETAARTSPELPDLPNFRPGEALGDPNQLYIDPTGTEGGNDGTGSTQAITVRKGCNLPAFPPSLDPVRVHFNARQRWEGHVIGAKGDTFTARLLPIGHGQLEQEAEIPIDEITPDERVFIEPGAVFYWSIGYLERPSGRVRESIIRFRRLPPWTTMERQAALSRSLELRRILDGE